jgi:imidazolonepropionase-like amidohydrolase
MGTDSGIGPHGTNLDELPLMEACGMTPAEVLAATTSSSARLLGYDDLGTVEPGRRADLVLVEGNAYDLKALPGSITEVWKDGVRAAL